MKVEQFVGSKSVAQTDFFLGLSKIGGTWTWDDGTPLFVKCEIHFNQSEAGFLVMCDPSMNEL
jgi:hypothetical protein